MKVLLAILKYTFISIVLGATVATTMHLYGMSRANRDNFIYIEGRKDGYNSCRKQNTGVIQPKGVIEAPENWVTTEYL